MINAKHYANRIDFVDSVIGQRPLQILDVGAGGLSANIPEQYRPMSRYLYRKIGPDNYTAIEPDPTKADRITNEFGVQNIRIADIGSFRSDRQFDLVFCGLILQYVYDLHSALSNVKSLLRPDGLLVLDFPNCMWYRNVIRYVIKSKARLDRDPYLWHHETIDSLAKKIQKAGFEIVESAFIGGINHVFFIPPKYSEFIGFKAKLT